MKKFFLFSCFSIFICSFCFSEISTIYSFKELDTPSADTLVIFDVDEVLITSEDVQCRPQGIKYRPKGWEEIDAATKNEWISIILKTTKFIHVDPYILPFLASLKRSGIQTMALTKAGTGKFGVIENCEEWRYEQLLQLGIDFSSSFPSQVFSFPGLVAEGKNPPLFKNGILFVADYDSKGKILGIFLDKIDLHPKKILFFDDIEENLLSVQEEMKNRGIACNCYLFRGADLLYHEVDERISSLQLYFISKKKQWLSEKEAQELLPFVN